MKNTYSSLFALLLLTTLLAGCGYNSTYKKQEQVVSRETTKIIETTEATENAKNIQNVAYTPDATTPIISGVELKNTYTTRFGEVNLITYPAFSFDYPDGWTITSEEVTTSSEKVILTNSTGVSITYWNFGETRDLTGPTRDMNYVDVTKVANSSFIPSYVQATDYSDLGKFMVAKLETTGYCDMVQGGEDVTLEDSYIRYALLPESQLGEQTEMVIIGLPTFSFWYANHISMIAHTSNGKFTEQEEKEVIAIIASFRDEYALEEDTSVAPESSGSHTAASIDELWSMLKGDWKFEEYIYRGQNVDHIDHTIKFEYVDNKPYMSRDAHKDGITLNGDFFYDLASIDAFHYDVYRYKKGGYGDDGVDRGDGIRLIWYSFDLSNISDGELLIDYNIAFDNGFVDNHKFRYSMENKK